MQVLKQSGKTVQSKSYLWLQRGGSPDEPVVLFDYDPSRSQTVPKVCWKASPYICRQMATMGITAWWLSVVWTSSVAWCTHADASQIESPSVHTPLTSSSIQLARKSDYTASHVLCLAAA